MQRTGVPSQTIVSIGYEAATSTLEVELATQEIIQYYNVPLATYISLMKAASKGDFYQHNIKAIFESKQITQEIINNSNDASNPINN